MFDSFDKTGFGNHEFHADDRVLIKYRYAEHYLSKGKILYINTYGARKGDCVVQLDNGEMVNYYHTNLEKIIDIICIPSGEAICMTIESAEELALTNMLKYDKNRRYYYCMDEEKWKIDRWSI